MRLHEEVSKAIRDIVNAPTQEETEAALTRAINLVNDSVQAFGKHHAHLVYMRRQSEETVSGRGELPSNKLAAFATLAERCRALGIAD